MSKKFGILESDLAAHFAESILAEKMDGFAEATNVRKDLVLALTNQTETVPHPTGNDADNPLEDLLIEHWSADMFGRRFKTLF